MKNASRAGFLALIGLFLFTSTAKAALWNPNLVLTDDQLEDSAAMPPKEIQRFLLEKGSLGIYADRDIDGRIKSAADIILRVSLNYKLNPKFLLSLIQREQGIVEGKVTDEKLAWAAGYSICDRCRKDHPELQGNSGFVTQLELAAARIRNVYLKEIDEFGKTFTGWGPGVPKSSGGQTIIPENRATAALYTYNPHAESNKLLWQIWQRWWSPRYPDGTLLREKNDPGVWYIYHGKRRPITSMAALVSRFDPKKIIPVPRGSLSVYEIGAPIKFPDFSILESNDGTLYLLRGDKKHPFISREAFRGLGFSPDEIIPAESADLETYALGAPIQAENAHPKGALLQDSETGGVYYVIDGLKHPIWSKEILRANWPNPYIIRASAESLLQFETGEPVKFNDGELVGVAGTPGIYAVSGGKRRPITSSEVFLAMGWKWDQVIWTSEKAVLLHPLGEPVTVIEEPVSQIAGL